jgi:hypothetical protein
LLLQKFKGLICYLKNLKDLFIINVKLKGPIDAFFLKSNIVLYLNGEQLKILKISCIRDVKLVK